MSGYQAFPNLQPPQKVGQTRHAPRTSEQLGGRPHPEVVSLAGLEEQKKAQVHADIFKFQQERQRQHDEAARQRREQAIADKEQKREARKADTEARMKAIKDEATFRYYETVQNLQSK